jgi:hypothetical protein
VCADLKLMEGMGDERLLTSSVDMTVRVWRMLTRTCDAIITDVSAVKLVGD